MRHLDLFSGIGGFALASTWVWGDEYQNVGHSEVDDYACKVYHRHFPESKCLGDITKNKWEEGQADLITGGFPCQPHSVAGKRKASADERDLWGECVRAVRGVRPRYAVFENVPGLLVSERGRFFNRVITDLAESGYDVEYRILSAASVGAPHKRERVWIVAHGIKLGLEGHAGDGTNGSEPGRKQPFSDRSTSTGSLCSDTTSERLAKPQTGKFDHNLCSIKRPDWWSVEPNVGRVAHGVPSRVDRLKGLGNAIVPQVAYQILMAIK